MSFDEDKIGKVVMNLLSNAFKFTPDGGRVDVALEMSKEMSGRLLIKVSDTGVGIRDEDKERILNVSIRWSRKNRSTSQRVAVLA